MPKVTRLEAAMPMLPVRKKVAAYARVSVDTESLKHSLSAQISHYSNLIQSNPGWEYAGVYADEGITGTYARADQTEVPADDCGLRKRKDRHAQLLRKVFGRQSEKMVYMDEEPTSEDPLSEKAEEPLDEHPMVPPVIPPAKSTGLIVLPGKKGNGKKKPRQGMNLDKMPADHIFEVDAAKLDALYGEGNWEIISWHIRRKVERIPELDYVQYTHVPVVAVGPERKLVALPFGDALRKYSIATASLVASIMLVQSQNLCDGVFRTYP